MSHDLIDTLAKAALDGKLGLVIGTGFAKTLTEGQKVRAPGWRELLEQIAGAGNIEVAHEVGQSFPQIASAIAAAYTAKHPSLSGDDARASEGATSGAAWLKLCVAQRAALMIPSPRRQRYREALRTIRPTWVVTTNYDLCIEQVVPEAAIVPPGQAFLHDGRRTPVFHLHGHRLDPASLVITEEDYVRVQRKLAQALLRPAFMLPECVTLVLGYGLKDPHVQSVLEWSRGGRELKQPVIQAVHNQLPTSRTYKGSFGQEVIEVADIANLLETIAQRTHELAARREHRLAEARHFLGTSGVLEGASPPPLASLPSAERRRVFELLKESAAIDGNTAVLSLLSESFVTVWSTAKELNQFSQYRDLLEMLFDAFSVWRSADSEAGIYGFLLSWFCQVAPYVGRGLGQSFAAHALWEEKKHELGSALRQDLSAHAQAHALLPVGKLLH